MRSKGHSVEEGVKNRFDSVLIAVQKVIDSCQTQEQLNNAFEWGKNVVLSLAGLVERVESTRAAKYAHSYKGYILSVIEERRNAKQGISGAPSQIPMGKVSMREIEPHIAVCRSCGGKGISSHISRRTCLDCGGSGRVKVTSTIKTLVQPFAPGRDDPQQPVKMDG